MKERPILFSGEMVRALLAGTKTQTRRIVKPQPQGGVLQHPVSRQWLESVDGAEAGLHCPYGSPAPLLRRPIPSTGAVYSAGDDGRIYRGDQPLKPWRGGYGQQYEMVSAGEQRKAYVHRLVCEAFYGSAPEGLLEVRHLDGDSLNNRPENLDWGTKEQNAADRSSHGRASREAHPAGKLTEAAVAEMHALRGSMTRPAMAARFGVAKGTVDDVLDGRTWIARTSPPPNLPRYQRQPGDRLWVRETFYAWGRWETRYSAKKGRDEWHFVDMTLECDRAYQYRGDRPQPLAGQRDGGSTPQWWKRPAIHMPRYASRITLEITAVRVERLQDISEADAQAEGCRCNKNTIAETGFATYHAAYANLWDQINGAGSWDANPFVWVVEFKRLQ